MESRELLPYAANVLHENRTVHYKRGKQLGDGHYVVEMSSMGESLLVCAANVERAESLVL